MKQGSVVYGKIKLVKGEVEPNTKCEIRMNRNSCRLQNRDVSIQVDEHSKRESKLSYPEEHPKEELFNRSVLSPTC